MPRVLTDVDALKALAHPLRQQLLDHLQRLGPATSAELAVEFGTDRGATSYHLRQLERYRFIEEDSALSAGRRRFWRAVPQDLRLPQRAADPEVAAAADEIGRLWYTRAERTLATYLRNRDSYGDFALAAQHSYGHTTLTAAELAQFGEEYLAFMSRWCREPDKASPDARAITVLFNAFPTPQEQP